MSKSLICFEYDNKRVRVKCKHGFGITSFTYPEAVEALEQFKTAIKQAEKDGCKND